MNTTSSVLQSLAPRRDFDFLALGLAVAALGIAFLPNLLAFKLFASSAAQATCEASSACKAVAFKDSSESMLSPSWVLSVTPTAASSAADRDRLSRDLMANVVRDQRRVRVVFAPATPASKTR